MANIIDVPTLSVWAGLGPTGIAVDDPFATAVLDLASNMVADVARHPDWLTGTTVPHAAYVICLRLARRTYLNTDGEVRSQTGPIGATVLDEMAASMRLTEAEVAELQGLQGDPDNPTNPNGLWVLTVNPSQPALSHTGYNFDSSGSDWGIPMVDLDESDAGVTDDDTLVP